MPPFVSNTLPDDEGGVGSGIGELAFTSVATRLLLDWQENQIRFHLQSGDPPCWGHGRLHPE